MTSLKWLNRWSGAVIGLALGSTDTLILILIGARVALGERDVTLLVGGYFTVNFAILGYLLGLSIETRRRELAVQRELSHRDARLASTQARLAQNEKLAALGQMASSMAHELRNPLAIIRSTLQNLEETLPAADVESREACHFMLEEIDRATRVTQEIVRFARPIEPKRTRLDSSELCQRTRALGERLLSDRPVRLQLSTDGASAALDADPDLVCQALLGLIDNAAHVTPAGGVITLEAIEHDDGIELCVVDAGPGVPEELRNKLFEPFFTTRREGAGLGLAVARQIAEAHGGGIRVSERSGGGARFALWLPRAREAA